MTESVQSRLLVRVRIWLVLFIVGLILSGITAFPLEHETGVLNRIFAVAPSAPVAGEPALHGWLRRVHEGIVQTNRDYPFMAYGTDWLAFAHLVIAVVFVGPLLDPVRNKWVLAFGVIACVGVLPLALIAGPIRGIPPYWRLIDCSFGIIGAIPLIICLRYVRQIEASGSSKRQATPVP
ncbi:hypothetical protein P8935_03455 [Telmatobacter sp. DSM 110680]|uniref:VanZ like family protein n=1 Tax=Telmatobacter sp. DSM 110680 TaxID=3036704 RepID=A0AAU7DM47_9BACT